MSAVLAPKPHGLDTAEARRRYYIAKALAFDLEAAQWRAHGLAERYNPNPPSCGLVRFSASRVDYLKSRAAECRRLAGEVA